MLRRNWLVAGLVLASTFAVLGAATLRKRAHPDFVDAEGFTLLQRAARLGDVAGIERLLAAGADPSLSTERQRRLLAPSRVRRWPMMGPREPVGSPPLIQAASGGHVEAVKRLLEAGAEVSANTIHEFVGVSHCEDCLREILPHWRDGGADPNLEGLTISIRSFNVEAARVFLEAGADPNRAPMPNEPDPLHQVLRGCETAGYPLRSWPPAPAGDGRRAELLGLLLEHGSRQLPHAKDLDLLPYDRAVGSCEWPGLAEAFEDHGAPRTDGPDGRLRAALFVRDHAAARAALLEGASPDQVLTNGQTLDGWLRANLAPGDQEPLLLLLKEARAAGGAAGRIEAPTPP